MAKAKVVHSQDGCTMIFKGDVKHPEPALGVIKFPGGEVEVSRTSDGSYWAHLSVDDDATLEDSRVDYRYQMAPENAEHIPSIPGEEYIQKLAIRVRGEI